MHFTAEVVLNGIAKAGAKGKCTAMGRAAMSLDLQVWSTCSGKGTCTDCQAHSPERLSWGESWIACVIACAHEVAWAACQWHSHG